MSAKVKVSCRTKPIPADGGTVVIQCTPEVSRLRPGDSILLPTEGGRVERFIVMDLCTPGSR
jgi:hypothetical protein